VQYNIAKNYKNCIVAYNSTRLRTVHSGSRNVTEQENGDTTLPCMNISGQDYLRHAPLFSWMFTAECCLISSATVRVGIRLSVWLVNGYARVVVLLSVVIVPDPHFKRLATTCKMYILL